MKIFSKYMFIALTASFALASCSDDDDYSAGPQDTADRAGVYFPSDNVSSLQLEPSDPTEVDVTVARLNTSGALEVPVTVQVNDNSVFEVPEKVVFADGESTTTLKVTFPHADTGISYTLVVTVPAEYISLYKEFDGGVSQSLSVERIKWVSAGSGSFYDNYYGVSGTVDVQNAEGTNRYRFMAPLANILEQNGYGRSGDVDYEFTLTDDGLVNIVPGIYDFEVGTDYYVEYDEADPNTSYVYQIYYDPDNYGSYCNVTNDNGTITWNFLYLSNGTDLYTDGGFVFEWTDGYPLAGE